MLKKRVIAAVAAALVAGGASAVTVSPDGVGDFLIAPAYFIGGGLTTELQVINTSNTYSTVAKLVFRNKSDSSEVLDFLIYLSPNDVWNGKISCAEVDKDGICTKSVVESSDDSTLMPTGTAFATAEVPFRVEGTSADQTTGTSKLTNEGYVDIEMGPAMLIAPNQTPKAGVSKLAVLTAYEARLAANAGMSQTDTPNILTGSVKANVPGFGSASIPMLALADYDSSIAPVIGVLSGFDRPGQQYTSLSDVEEALWKNNIVLPYSKIDGGFSLATLTFPTKLTYRRALALGQYAFTTATDANKTTPVCYTVDMFDTTEQTVVGGRTNISPLPTNPPSCSTEMDFKLFGQPGLVTPFSSGWARLKFAAPQSVASQTNAADNRNFKVGTARSGVPVIATYMIRGVSGDLTWAYAASSFSLPGTLNGSNVPNVPAASTPLVAR